MWLQQNFHKMNLFPMKQFISEELASPDGKRLIGISQEALLLSAPYGHSLWTSFRAALRPSLCFGKSSPYTAVPCF